MADTNGTGSGTHGNGHANGSHLFHDGGAGGAAILGVRPTEAQEYALNELAINEFTLRMDYLLRLADPRRDIDYECGFPKGQLPAQMYQDLYDYDSIANRVVEVLPKEMWQVQPLVYEKEEGSRATGWEKEWDQLGSSLSPTKSWYKEEQGSAIWDTLLRADIACGIGQFAIILLGVDDGKEYRYPVDGMDPDDSGALYTGTDQQYWDYLGQVQRSEVAQREIDKEQLKSMVPYNPYQPAREIKRSKKRHKLLWMRVFPESLVQVIRWEARRASPRFGEPVMYLVTLVDPRHSTTGIGRPLGVVQVHWTRVVHIVDNPTSSPQLGVPRMQPVRKHLYSLQKVYGASGEGYWRSAFPILHTKTQPGLGQVKYNKEKMKGMMERLFNSMDRSAVTTGFDMEMLTPSVLDPTPYIDKNIEGICVKIPCPVPVFKGYEIGEQASTNNDEKWNDVLSGRQGHHGTPRVIVPFIDRVILLNILPEPGDGYKIEWPSYDTQSDSEKATVASTKATTLSTYAGPGNAASVYPPFEFLTRVMGEKEEVADAILAAAEAHTEEANQQQMDQQQQMIDQGLAPDPQAPQQEPGQGQEQGGDGGQPDQTQNLRERSQSELDLRRKMVKLKKKHSKIKTQYKKERAKTRKVAEKDREEQESLRAEQQKVQSDLDRKSTEEERAHEIALAKVKKGPVEPPIVETGTPYGGLSYFSGIVGNATSSDFKRVGDLLRNSPLAMPGYGQIFVNDENPDPMDEVWYVGGDGDEDGFSALVEETLRGIGVKSVRYEAEEFPPKDQSWVMVYPDKKAWTKNVFCPTGEGGGIDPSCGRSSGGDKNASFDRGSRIADPNSAAFGGRPPNSTQELRNVFHQTSPENAIKILQGGYFKPTVHLSTDLAREGYGDTKDGGEYVYVGLRKEASAFAAVSTGVVFQLNLNPVKERCVIQPEQEGGIALVHGRISTKEIAILAVHIASPNSKEGRAVAQAWLSYKKTLNRDTLNCNPGQLRGVDGRCGPGIGVSIPRKEMPQIESHDTGDFLNFARERGVTVSGDRVPAESLSPTQSQFRQERVDSLPVSSLAMPLFVSSDDYILDGTHRWVKHWQGNPNSQVPVYRINLPLEDSLQLMRDYPKSVTVDNSFCATGKGGGVNDTCSPSSPNPVGVGGKPSVRGHLLAVTAAKGAKTQVTVPPRPTISPVHEQTTAGGAKIREMPLPHRYDAEFEANGAIYDFGAEKRHDPRGAYWYVAFARKTGLGGTYKVTGSAGTQAVRIMRTIGGIMERFVDKYSPDKFKFTADGDEPSRVKLYNRFATAFAASKGYELETHGRQVHIQDKGPTMHYTFTKKPERT